MASEHGQPADTTFQRLGMTTQGVDSVKGLLILFIVVGHNTYCSEVAPGLRSALYNFHVLGFLLLPFLLSSPRMTRRFIGDRLVRYLVPYIVFYGIASILYYVMYTRGDGVGPWLHDAVIGLVIGSAAKLDAGCGFQLFWFLPALLSLVMIRAAIETTPRYIGYVIFGICVLVHCCIGAAPDSAKPWIPLGLGAAAYSIPLGVVARGLWSSWARAPRWVWMVLYGGVFAGSSILVLAAQSVNGVGPLLVRDIAQPSLLVLHAVVAVSALLFFCSISSGLSRVPGVSACGRHSLMIFLVHSLIFQLIVLIVRRAGLERDGGLTSNLIIMASSLVLTVLLSYAVAAMVNRITWMRRTITPASMNDWAVRSLWRRMTKSDS